MLVVAGPEPDARPDAVHRRAAAGRGLAVHVRGGDGGREGRQRRARRAGARRAGAARLPGARPHRRRGWRTFLRDEGLEVVHVAVPGEVRVAAIVLEAGGRVTVLNEPGPELPPASWTAYEQAVDAALAARSCLVCSGSLPPGAPAESYARLAEIARRRGTVSIVDAAGPALAAALPAADVVTPNLAEAENVLGGATRDGVQPPAPEARERALAAAAGLVDRGGRSVVVTAGAAGVAVAGVGEPRWRPAPPVRAVRNPVGAGDSFTAGLALGLARGTSLADAVGEALAAAAASVETDVAGLVDPERVRELACDTALREESSRAGEVEAR